MDDRTVVQGYLRLGYPGKCLHVLTGILCVNVLALYARSVPQLAEYCPPDPAVGHLIFKSVDGASLTCLPGLSDPVGQAVFECWQEFFIEITGCQVLMRTIPDQYMGPGRLPCHLLGIYGNLTGEGVEAQIWAYADGIELLSYYYVDQEAVEALRYEDSRQVLRGIWDFMLNFTGDLHFANTTWIDEEFNRLSEQATAEMDVKSRDLNQPDHNEEALMHNIHQLKWPEKLPDHEAHHQSLLGNIPDFNDLGQAWRWRRRVQEAVVPAQYAGASTSGRDKQSGVVSELGTRATFLRGHHSPMRVYRVSETRVVLRVPHTGCKYRFTVNPDSLVFESPSRHHAHVEWHSILLAAACLSVILSVVGLGACTYFSHKHAEYVASYWEYQAVKDQLGSELPPSAYVRLFGEEPRSTTATNPVKAGPLAAAPTAELPQPSDSTAVEHSSTPKA